MDIFAQGLQMLLVFVTLGLFIFAVITSLEK